MARYCICGCGKELRDKDGYTDYDRLFFAAECRNSDKTQRIRDQRLRMKDQRRCTKCGQAIPGNNGKKVKAAEV